ncbi:MAG: MATE family efflux transporter [Bacillaceae bacterium]|nr:MATE family efflux transporter [Bacillaceae bacterium]
MYPTKNLTEKMKLFAVIVFPILITQIGMYAMNFFDTVMSGRAGADELAGVAIGSSIWVPVFTGINGILLALSPIVAHLTGADQKEDVPEAIRQGIYLSIGLATMIMLAGWSLLDPILSMMDLEPNVKHVAKYYLVALGFGIIPLFIYNTLRSFIDALGQTRVSMIIILIALPVNVVLNYIFIFGKFGVPALGGIGAGVASSITYLFTMMLSVYIIYKHHPFAKFHIFGDWKHPSFTAWWEQLKIGVPIGFAIFFETSIFAAVTLLMSVYNTVTIAAHQAAINFASFLYMMPLSISMALTIAVGFEAGGKRFRDARQYSIIGITIAVVFALIGGAGIYAFDDAIASLYSNHQAVIELTKQFLWFAIFFQLSDAFGAPIQGALRGYKDVKVTLLMAFISYWLIGLPSGYLMARYTDIGPFGYWIGLIAGLAAGAVTLMFRLLYIQKKKERMSLKS